MAVAYYLDTGAAVKGYVSERGSRRVVQLLEGDAGYELYLSRIGTVEIAAAIFGKVRAGEARSGEALSAVTRLRADVDAVYRVVEVDPAMADRAIEVAAHHRLRACDCLQLAAALLLQEQRDALGLAPLTFASSDRELGAADRAEGLTVEDPALS